jgi:hypothetical protein
MSPPHPFSMLVLGPVDRGPEQVNKLLTAPSKAPSSLPANPVSAAERLQHHAKYDEAEQLALAVFHRKTSSKQERQAALVQVARTMLIKGDLIQGPQSLLADAAVEAQRMSLSTEPLFDGAFLPTDPKTRFFDLYAIGLVGRGLRHRDQCRLALQRMADFLDEIELADASLITNFLIETFWHEFMWPADEPFVASLAEACNLGDRVQNLERFAVRVDERLHWKAIHTLGAYQQRSDKINACREHFERTPDRLGVVSCRLSLASLASMQHFQQQVQHELGQACDVLGAGELNLLAKERWVRRIMAFSTERGYLDPDAMVDKGENCFRRVTNGWFIAFRGKEAVSRSVNFERLQKVLLKGQEDKSVSLDELAGGEVPFLREVERESNSEALDELWRERDRLLEQVERAVNNEDTSVLRTLAPELHKVELAIWNAKRPLERTAYQKARHKVETSLSRAYEELRDAKLFELATHLKESIKPVGGCWIYRRPKAEVWHF